MLAGGLQPEVPISHQGNDMGDHVRRLLTLVGISLLCHAGHLQHACTAMMQYNSRGPCADMSI